MNMDVLFGCCEFNDYLCMFLSYLKFFFSLLCLEFQAKLVRSVRVVSEINLSSGGNTEDHRNSINVIVFHVPNMIINH